MTTKPQTRREVRRSQRIAARRMLGLTRHELARRCGWRGVSRVANTENSGTPYEDTARTIFYHLRQEAARQGVTLPITLDIYL